MDPRTGLRRLSAAFVFSLLLTGPIPSLAGDCESQFREVQAADGSRGYISTAPHEVNDARSVLEQFAGVAKQHGYVVIAPPDVSRQVATLGIARSSAPGPMMVTADPAGSAVSVTSIVPAGVSADPARERAAVCSLLAAFQAASPSQVATHADHGRNDGFDDPSRTSLPRATPKVNQLSPRSRFDAAAARAALQPGSSVIRGQACGGINTELAYASSVTLFPVTPYLEELLALQKKAKPGRDSVTAEPEALTTRMVAEADTEGRFQFSKMRPGRYYLTTTVTGVFGATRDVQVGRVESGFGSANVYAKQQYTYDAESTIGKFVTVKEDGEVVTVTLQPPISANPFRRGMHGSILGCRRLW